MAEATLVIDGQTAAGTGGTVSGSYEVSSGRYSSRYGVRHAIIVQADVNGTDLDVQANMTFSGTTGEAQAQADSVFTALDATTWDQVVYPEDRGAETLEITVTNNNASSSVVSVWVVPYRTV